MGYEPQPAIRGKNVKLTSVNRYTIPDLFSMQNNVDEMYLWTATRDILSENQLEQAFIQNLSKQYHTYLLIYNNEDTCCGLIYSYEYNFLDGYTFVSIYIKPKFRKHKVAFEGGMLFFDYLFTYFPIRKIYCDVLAYNAESRHFMEKTGLTLEGELHDHKFYAGKYHNLLKFSMFREAFYEKYQKMLDAFKSKE